MDPLSLRYLQPLQNSNFKFKQCLKPTDEGYSEIKGTLFAIFKIIRQKERHYGILLKSKSEELIYLFYYYRLVERKTSDDHYRKNEKIREIIDHINKHYVETLTIEQLSELMGYSKTHFMTIFKQHTGTSCTEFIIIQDRLNAACEELRNSVKPVLEISTSVGFNNLSNFNRQLSIIMLKHRASTGRHIATRKQIRVNHWLTLIIYAEKLFSFSLYLCVCH